MRRHEGHNLDRARSAPRPHDDAQFDRLVSEALRSDSAAPDLTRSIMGRLGYMRVAPMVVRRQRRRRWAARSAFGVMLLGAIGAGILLHNASPDARGPVEMTVPAAISHDVETHQERIDALMNMLRDMTPPGTAIPEGFSTEPPGGSFELDEDVDRSAIGPVRFI